MKFKPDPQSVGAATLKQAAFKKGQKVISHDITHHKGGFWKVFKAKGMVRTGTWDKWLKNKVGR